MGGGPARTPAHDYDAKARDASGPHGWSTGPASAEFQIYSHCQEPTRSGDARTDRGPRRCASPTAGCAGPGTGAADRHYAGRGPAPGTEADAGRATVPSD